MKPKILIVDDEKPLRDTLAKWFKPSYDCLVAPDAEQALKTLEANPDTVLMLSDVRMEPGMSGVELLRKAKAANPSLACILLTAYGTVDLAVEAMKDGADDFVQKPVTDLAQLELRVAKAIKTAALQQEVESLKRELNVRIENFTGNSPAMERVYALIRKAAPASANVLVEGPSGTGKELVARSLHNLSPRAKGPFVAVECAALSKDLLESELFGYEKNAFTGADQKGRVGRFEAASGGTLFLDEIGEVDLATQVKLLRVLESRTFQRVGGNEDIRADFRLVTATNRDLLKMVGAGDFREDLYYRLNVIDIHLPALRERPGDIALLASRFLKEFSAANGGTVTGIDAQAMKALEDYSWPGNVRQLRNVIEKMVVLAAAPRLTLDDVPLEVRAGGGDANRSEEPQTTDKGQRTEAQGQEATNRKSANAPTLNLAESEKAQILSALERCRYNKSKAAELLGISRRTLHRKLKEWGEQ